MIYCWLTFGAAVFVAGAAGFALPSFFASFTGPEVPAKVRVSHKAQGGIFTCTRCRNDPIVRTKSELEN